MFQLRGGGQNIVGIVGRVGLKMFKHHGEQIFARKALRYFARLRCNGQRVAVVDQDGFHLWAPLSAARVVQVVADGGHVQNAWPPGAQQIWAVQVLFVHFEVAGVAQQHAACSVTPSAG